ncbi:hypothetical protein [Amycolatopsis orientalis]|uniref:hypothetical protein n=1 Tax=Amycolatopsis orientalis TaxID=31958 RepID=UPI001319D7A4|nr:hypothetical protein [Amycolatopsis orientalis]
MTPDIIPVQAVNSSIDGTATVERFGTKRSWKLDYKGLTEDLESILTMALTGALAGPLYLVDPLTTNLLSPIVATAGSTPGRNPFTTSVPGLSADIVAATAPFAVTPGHRNQVTSVNSSGVTQTLWTPAVPVRPVVHTFSAYVKASANVGVQLSDGNAVIGTASTGTPSAWTRVSVSATSATGTLLPTFSVPNGATLQLAALQLEASATATPWRPGGGVCRVYVSSADRSSVLWPYRDNAVTISEV